MAVALASILCACEQTDPASSRGAGGAVVGAPVKGADPSVVTDNKHPEGALELNRTRQKELLRLEAPPPGADAATRDAASGLPTGKRQHKPVTVAQ
jgi:hypothetical protein